MEKKMLLFLIAVSVLIFSCTSGGDRNTAAARADSTVSTGDSSLGGGGDDSFCVFIPKDSANKMINSYLGSINYPSNDSDLYSIIIDVTKLNAYLNTTGSTGQKATKIKLMFAHTLDYINSGGQNRNCGYKSGKLTLVLATYDSAGNYIYMNGNKVLDRTQPCPNFCPVTTGTASANTLP
jgi:hypothetical protein